jgi:UDP-glucose 4-epimerase
LAQYLVTGGAGFIGSNLVRYLLERKDEVRVLDNFSTGKRQNLEEVADRIELIEGDLCDAEVTDRAVRGVNFVLHQAAIPSVPRSVEAPLESHSANATGTLILLEAARRAKVKRLVYASSSSVYGANETLPKQETMQTEPMSPYAVAKLAAEHYCMVYHRLYGLETVALRYFNVFGPRQDPSSPYSGVISQFIDAIGSGSSPVIYGDGEQTRDFTFVENVAQANLAACAAGEGAGRAYNIGCAKRFSINELWATMTRLAGVDRKADHKESRAGDVRHSLADVSRAEQLLGYVPRVAFADGLERTLRFYGVLKDQRGGS